MVLIRRQAAGGRRESGAGQAFGDDPGCATGGRLTTEYRYQAWNSYSYGQGQSTGGKNPAGLSPLFGA